MSPGFSWSTNLGKGRRGLPHVNHERETEERGHLLRTAQHLDVVGRHPLRQTRFDPDDIVAMPRDRGFRGVDVGQPEVVRVTVWQDALAADVD